MTELRALVALGLALAGCASTGGRDWLDSPIDERAQMLSPEPDANLVTTEARSEAPPRLRHTVTLGESYAVSAPRAAPTSGPGLQVNVNVPVTINNPASYGYGYGYYPAPHRAPSFAAPARATRSTEAKVGADFPPPPDYGPRALK